MRPISLPIVPEPHWRGLAGALSQGNPWFPHGPPPCACLSKNHFEAPAGRSPAPPPIPCDPSASSSSPSPTGEVWRERYRRGTHGSPTDPLLVRVYPRTTLRLPPGEARLRRPFHATHQPPHRPRAPLARSGGSVIAGEPMVPPRTPSLCVSIHEPL